MHVSQFVGINYRSLKQVRVRLEPGKNVIVGKNNSGKSNIIKALEILIGERFPSSQNITANDFYTCEVVIAETGEQVERIADDFYLEATLSGRDFDQSLIRSMKKKTAFSKVQSADDLYRLDGKTIVVNYELFQNLDDLESRPEIVVLDTYSGGREKKTEWKTGEDVITFLSTAKTIKIFFCKNRDEDEKAGFGLIVVDPANCVWITHFLPKKLRDALVTTTVISALRSHKDELRLVHYTWFGKLVQGLWEKNRKSVEPTSKQTYDSLIRERSGNIKELVDQLFAKETEDIRKLLEGAIAYKAVSFKFMNDNGNELYKNIQLFINDGIDRPLAEKGTGIQSAIIISLFSLYCDQFHKSSSLLIAEEPELFLHPQARRVISAELNKFLDSCKEQPRQLIISTHSTEYLKNVEPYNVVRVTKDTQHNCSETHQLKADVATEITTEIKRVLWHNNTEIFFADKVLLVEGGELYLLPAIVDKVTGQKQKLDYENITVARINGKGNFLTYIKMLECFGIKYVMLGDLDCLKDEIPKIVSHLNLTHLNADLRKVKEAIGNMTVNYPKIADRLKDADKNLDAQDVLRLFEKVSAGSIASDDADLLSMISYMQSRFTKGDKYSAIVQEVGLDKVQTLHQGLRANNLFVWERGDLESCYTVEAKSIKASKDITALTIAHRLTDPETDVDQFFNNRAEIEELVSILIKKPDLLNVLSEAPVAEQNRGNDLESSTTEASQLSDKEVLANSQPVESAI